jgi:hypothetical protein
MKRSAILLVGALLALAACSGADAPSADATIVETAEEEALSPTAVEAEEDDEDGTGTFLCVFGNRFVFPIYIIARRDLEEAGYDVIVASYTREPLRGYNTTRIVTANVLLEVYVHLGSLSPPRSLCTRMTLWR